MFVRIPTPVGVAPNIEVVKWLMWATRFTDWNIAMHETNAGIADSRNQICEDFLNSGYEQLWMIDSDVVPNTRPIKGDYSVMCGVYPHIIDNFGERRIVWSAWEEDGGGYIPMALKDHRFPVDAAGTGCMRLDRKILEKVEFPWFENHFERGSRRMILGEDFDFCRKVKAAGEKVWVDPNYRCHHMKMASIGQVEDAAKNSLKMAEAA